ncbi:MAG: hypothetical protein MUF20_13565 [Methylotetracoccus sp.]|nr:hypothetical protein [Methylotetracoccus sp.]
MKVCIPCTHSDTERGQLHIPYGDAPFFAFWDSATGQFEFESNPLAGKDDACACAITRWVRKLGAHVFITADIGRRAAARLVQAGVQALHAPDGSVAQVLAQCRAGSLPFSPSGEPVRNCRDRAGDHHAHEAGSRCGHQHHGEGSHSGWGCHH